jgi:hypothetical protein
MAEHLDFQERCEKHTLEEATLLESEPAQYH